MKVLSVLLGAVIVVMTILSFNNKTEHKLLASEKYKVIKVNGQILFKKTQSKMKSGDFFVSGTPLSFESQQSRAAIVSKLKGRFVISPSSKGKIKILPAANNVSSRAGALINLIDIKNHFSGDYLVIGDMELEIGEKAFPQNDVHFFYLTYIYNNELIRKKLRSDGNKLILDKNEIFKVDGKTIPVEKYEMTLFYREGKTSKTINTFSPVFPNLDELKSEVQIILDEFSEKKEDEKVEEVTSYLNEFYGKPYKDNLSIWLKREFNL
jgi:hypothetical protein